MRLFSPSRKPGLLAILPLLPLLLAGCAVGPQYERPSAPMSAAYKEVQPGWVQAAPADALDRGAWWTLFNDPILNELAGSVEVSNQNVAAAAAAYAQARALVQEQRSSLFPLVTLGGSADRTGGNVSSASQSATARRTRYQVDIGASWEPDVWGRLRAGVTGATASAQASEADLASASLSAQGEVAANYFSLRQTDAQLALLRDTIASYERVLQIARNRYAAAQVPKTDVLQAETQLANAQADELGLQRQRAQLEHAIAVLIGKPPGEFGLPPSEWNVTVPAVPVGVPSVLLQRRPDIAAAERRVAAANAEIGIAEAGYYPSFGLSASYGAAASNVTNLFNASATLWSLGISVAQTVFDAGATSARVTAARAAHDGAVANYRQTVLVAFQSVEDQLAAARLLESQQALRRQASAAADQAEQQLLNRYRAGQISYSDVIVTQVAALNARRALVQAQADRQTAAIALIQALGGGWQGPVQ